MKMISFSPIQEIIFKEKYIISYNLRAEMVRTSPLVSFLHISLSCIISEVILVEKTISLV